MTTVIVIRDVRRQTWTHPKRLETTCPLNPRNLPLDPVVDGSGKPVVCSVRIFGEPIHFHAWRINVGRVPVYLLDSNRP